MMKAAVLLLVTGFVALAFSNTTPPYSTTAHTSRQHHHHTPHGPLYNLIKQEVGALLHSHPDLNFSNCSTKCDALFDLISHHNEKLTDGLCAYECKRQLST